MKEGIRKTVDSIYDGIMKGFTDNVCKPSENQETFIEFKNKVELSRQFAYKHPEFALLQKILNDFACDWDEEIQRNRKARNPEHMLEPYHRFLLVPNSDWNSAFPLIQASMYVKGELPDSRFVAINFCSLKYDTLRCIMHEMGHFIGYRNRESRLYDFFIPLLADRICHYVYECACSYATFNELNKPSWGMAYYSEDESYSKRTNYFAFCVINCLQIIHPVLIENIKQSYTLVRDMYTDISINTKITPNEVNSIQSGFFCSVDYVVLTAICRLLSSHDFSDKIRRLVIEFSNKHCSSLQEELLDRIQAGFSFISFTLSNNGIKPEWYTECEDILEEAAADMFMIKMDKMNPKKYIDLMTKQIQSLPSVNSLADMQSALAQRAVNIRVVGVMQAMGTKPALVYDLIQWVILHVLPHNNRLYKRACIRRNLIEMQKKAKELASDPKITDFFDPTRYAFPYIQGLWDDYRYETFVSQHSKCINLLKHYWRFMRLPGASKVAQAWLSIKRIISNRKRE